MIDAIVQRRLAAADVVEEAAQQRLTVGRVDDLGVELHAVDAALDVLEHGDGRLGRAGRDAEARTGARTMESKWLIHTTWCSGSSSTDGSPFGVEVGAAVLALARCGPPRRRAAGR